MPLYSRTSSTEKETSSSLLFKMDDGFELSEEDFLKAALDIEAATQQQNQPTITENVTRQDRTFQTAEGAFSSRTTLATSSSIFNDSDDSDIDLSLSIGQSENLCGYNPKQTGNNAFNAASVPASKLTVSSNQNSKNANGFVNITPAGPKLRTTDSFKNVPPKLPSNEVLLSSANLSRISNFKQLENEVVEYQASKSLSLVNQGRAVSSPRLPTVVSRSTFPSVSSDKNRMRKRKFPGPAGILPNLNAGSKVDNIFSEIPSNLTDVPTSEAAVLDVPCSQSQEIHFHSNAWKAMKDDLGAQAELILTDFCIDSIIQKANAKMLPRGKVPVLCAVIEGVKVHSADASVTLRDPSGFIYGTMHRELLRDHLERIQTGTVIVLRQVGVLCPSGRRNFYLNITPNNVVGFYSVEESGQLLTLKVRELTEEDFLMLTEEPSQLNSNGSVASPQLERQLETVQSTGALFSTVLSNPPFNQCNRAGSSFSNPRFLVHPNGPALSFGRGFESVKSSTCSTVANNTARSFAVPSVVQRPITPIRMPASPSPLRPALSRAPNLTPHRTQSVPFQPRPASVQPVPRFSSPMPCQLLTSFSQSNAVTGFDPFPDATTTTFMQNTFVSKENLLDSRNNSPGSQSTFRFKKLSTTKSPQSCASGESTKDPFKETIAMNNPSAVWTDYSDYIDDSLLSDLSNEFFSDF